MSEKFHLNCLSHFRLFSSSSVLSTPLLPILPPQFLLYSHLFSFLFFLYSLLPFFLSTINLSLELSSLYLIYHFRNNTPATRKLHLSPQLGIVDLELEFQDGSKRSFTANPMQVKEIIRNYPTYFLFVAYYLCIDW